MRGFREGDDCGQGVGVSRPRGPADKDAKNATQRPQAQEEYRRVGHQSTRMNTKRFHAMAQRTQRKGHGPRKYRRVGHQSTRRGSAPTLCISVQKLCGTLWFDFYSSSSPFPPAVDIIPLIRFPLLKTLHMKIRLLAAILVSLVVSSAAYSQALRIPQNTNFTRTAGARVGVTDIQIHYNAPGVKGREGKIYGTDIVHYGYTVLGFGSTTASPWRAGADECTVMSFSTDVTINGKKLPAGKYAFFIEVHPDSSVLIFNTNTKEWGSYFYRKELDVLNVPTVQVKNMPTLTERLTYNFSNQTDHSIDISLDWERWSFPMHVEVDLKATVLEDIRQQMSGAIGFDPPSLEAAAQWCVANDINYEEALNWINSATNPQLGGRNSFAALSTKSAILKKLGKDKEATDIMNTALENATVMEIHTYGRQLLNEKKLPEALAVFQKNYDKNKGAWPTNAGLMRIYSAMGDYKKALTYAKAALAQAPDDQNKKFLEGAVKTLSEGKAL